MALSSELKLIAAVGLFVIGIVLTMFEALIVQLLFHSSESLGAIVFTTARPLIFACVFVYIVYTAYHLLNTQ